MIMKTSHSSTSLSAFCLTTALSFLTGMIVVVNGENHNTNETLVVGNMSAVAMSCDNGVDLSNSQLDGDFFNPSVWPEMWRMVSDDIIEANDSRQAPNKLNDDDDDDSAVDAEVLAMAGVKYMHLDPTGYEYPNSQIPWEPNTTDGSVLLDPVLVALREEMNFSYADIITVESRVDSFWDEHFHEFDTIRYIINGSGYFDLRDVNNEWVRFKVQTGDFFLWPGGIYHRFTVDENNFITAMRLFQGSPVWNSFARDEVKGNHDARMAYVDTFLCGEDPDKDANAHVQDDDDDDEKGTGTSAPTAPDDPVSSDDSTSADGALTVVPSLFASFWIVLGSGLMCLC